MFSFENEQGLKAVGESLFEVPAGVTANPVDGETRLDDRARARQLLATFDPVWERARPCSEYRALGI